MHANTQKLLERMNAAGMRQDFFVDKNKAKELISRIYALHNLPIPSFTWVKDITDKRLLETSMTASRASWASWASRASSASRASRASSASWASSAGVDYDFDYFLDSYEWLQTNKGNENDEKFIQSMFLFLEAKENGAGYFSEFEGKGYIAPRCVIQLDEQYQYHSEIKPSIQWESGLSYYFLHGIKFEKELWGKIVNKTIPAKELLTLPNQDQRIVALKTYGWERLLSEIKPKILDEQNIIINGKLLRHQVLEINQDGWIGRFLKFTDPADKDEGLLRVNHNLPETATVIGARKYGFLPLLQAVGAQDFEFGLEG